MRTKIENYYAIFSEAGLKIIYKIYYACIVFFKIFTILAASKRIAKKA